MISDIKNQADDLSIANHSLKILNQTNQSTFQSPSQHLEFKISDLNPQTLNAHKRRLHQLATEALLKKVQIYFYGLEELRKKNEMGYNEKWDPKNNYSTERELYNLINTIQLESNLSSRRFYIKLVN